MTDAIENATHEQLDDLISAWQQDLSKSNDLQRSMLRNYINKAYGRLVREGRYSADLIEAILDGKRRRFSAEYVANSLSTSSKFITNVKEGTWADTQGELATAQRALEKLIFDLYWIVDKSTVASHIRRIAELQKREE